MDPKEYVINSLAEDKDIYAYACLLAFWQITDDPQKGYTDFPSKEEILIKVRESIMQNLDFMQESIEKQNAPVEQIFYNPDFISFVREGVIHNLTNTISDYPVFNMDMNESWLDTCKCNASKDFIQNLHYNLITSRKIMRHVTSSMILLGYINQNTDNDYDFITDKTYEVISVVFLNMNQRFTRILDTMPQTNFKEYLSIVSTKALTEAVVKHMPVVNVDSEVIVRLMPAFMSELSEINCKYIVEVFKSKAPNINAMLDHLHRYKNN